MEHRRPFGAGLLAIALGNLLVALWQFRVGGATVATFVAASGTFVGVLGVLTLSDSWTVFDDPAVSNGTIRAAAVLCLVAGGLLTILGVVLNLR
jgi:hypothetical protein